MGDTDRMARRFAIPTRRSRLLGNKLRELREGRGLTLVAAQPVLRCSPSRISRIEQGLIRPSATTVRDWLIAYWVDPGGETGKLLIDMADKLAEGGWWLRHGTMPPPYLSYISAEEEATRVRNFELAVVPGLLQTPEYAAAVSRIGLEDDVKAIKQRVEARLRRQEALHREGSPLRVHAIISEAALLVQYGAFDVIRGQLAQLVELATLPNVTVQVVRFAAGGLGRVSGGFVILDFAAGEAPLGCVESVGGSLFLETPTEVDRIEEEWTHLASLAESPHESVNTIKEMCGAQ